MEAVAAREFLGPVSAEPRRLGVRGSSAPGHAARAGRGVERGQVAVPEGKEERVQAVAGLHLSAEPTVRVESRPW